MNIEQLEGNWEQVKGQIHQKWGKLTNDDLSEIAGKKDKLLGKLRERYGYGKDEAENKLVTLVKTFEIPSNGEKSAK